MLAKYWRESGTGATRTVWEDLHRSKERQLRLMASTMVSESGPATVAPIVFGLFRRPRAKWSINDYFMKFELSEASFIYRNAHWSICASLFSLFRGKRFERRIWIASSAGSWKLAGGLPGTESVQCWFPSSSSDYRMQHRCRSLCANNFACRFWVLWKQWPRRQSAALWPRYKCHRRALNTFDSPGGRILGRRTRSSLAREKYAEKERIWEE